MFWCPFKHEFPIFIGMNFDWMNSNGWRRMVSMVIQIELEIQNDDDLIKKI